MAIKIGRDIKIISQQQFFKIDYLITGLAYKVHNEFGRLWSEEIYQNELANRCRKAGYENIVMEEVILVSHKNFEKKYYIDFLVDDSIIYELKTVKGLTSEHDKQTLNYLFLVGLQHGKLINFRTPSVQKRFVSTALCPQDRYNFFIHVKQWLGLGQESIWLKEMILELLGDWGAYLETNLYYEAICQFLGGEDNVIKNVNVVHNNLKIGNRKVHLLNLSIAFKITALTKGSLSFERHLQRFINLTNLAAIQWINFNQNEIVFKTSLNQKNNYSANKLFCQ